MKLFFARLHAMKTPRRTFYILSFLACLLMAGCAPVISRPVQESANKDLSFGQILKAPATYRGEVVLLGGRVIGVENLADTTLVEVLEYPLGRRLRPLADKASEGRFLARFKGFVDPLVYRGRLITLAGRLSEPLTRPLGGTTYTYPILDVSEHYLWRSGADKAPAISIGIGLGISGGY